MNAPKVAQDNPIPQSYVSATTPETNPDLSFPVEADFSRASWVLVTWQRAGIEITKVCCTHCGEARQTEHDEEHEIVRRIVRESATFHFDKKVLHGGDEVYVEPRFLSGAILDTTVSPREWEAEQERKRRRVERQPPMLMQMVNRATAGQASTKDVNAAGRELMNRNLAEKAERSRELMRRRGIPVDQEASAAARKDVEDV